MTGKLEDKKFYFVILFGKETRCSVGDPQSLISLGLSIERMLRNYSGNVSFKIHAESPEGRDIGGRQAKLTESNIRKAAERVSQARFQSMSISDSRHFDELDVFLELHKYWQFNGKVFSERTNYVAENSVSFGINIGRFAEPGVELESFVKFFKDLFVRIDGVYGYSDFGCSFGQPSPSDPSVITNRMLSYAWHEVKEDFRCKKIDMSRNVFDVHWENFLSEGHVRALGGVPTLQRACETVEELGSGRYYARLTKHLPAEKSDDQLKFEFASERLKPILSLKG